MSKKEGPIYETEDFSQHVNRLNATIGLRSLSKLIQTRIEELKAEILEKYNFLEINTDGKYQIEDGHGGYYDDIIKSRDLVIIYPELSVVGILKYENFASDISIFRRDDY